MKDRDTDTHLKQHLSGEPPRGAFREKTLRDSTAEFIRTRRRRSAMRRVELAAAVILISCVAFLAGRLSAPPTLPKGVDDTPQAAAASQTPREQGEGVTVPNDLVAWLEAANLFRQLGMTDRMARAINRAEKLLPAEMAAAGDRSRQVFAAGGAVENQKENTGPTSIADPKSSTENGNRILAQIFGD